MAARVMPTRVEQRRRLAPRPRPRCCGAAALLLCRALGARAAVRLLLLRRLLLRSSRGDALAHAPATWTRRATARAAACRRSHPWRRGGGGGNLMGGFLTRRDIRRDLLNHGAGGRRVTWRGCDDGTGTRGHALCRGCPRRHRPTGAAAEPRVTLCLALGPRRISRAGAALDAALGVVRRSEW